MLNLARLYFRVALCTEVRLTLKMAAHTGADAADDDQAGRHVAAVFEKFDRNAYECQELLSQATSHWMLSTDEPVRAAAAVVGVMTSTEPPPGIISSFTAHPQSRVILLVPADDTGFVGELDMREVPYISHIL